MTICAIGVEHSEMELRVGMTGHTLGREAGKLAACMAGFTSYINVRTIQREVAAIVVKRYIFPIKRGMAGSAVHTKSTAMFIILAMAGVTIVGYTLVAILVTTLASDFSMLSLQLESREIVVERCSLPTTGCMAGATICTKAGCMRVIRAMAGKTILWRGCEIS